MKWRRSLRSMSQTATTTMPATARKAIFAIVRPTGGATRPLRTPAGVPHPHRPADEEKNHRQADPCEPDVQVSVDDAVDFLLIAGAGGLDRQAACLAQDNDHDGRTRRSGRRA